MDIMCELDWVIAGVLLASTLLGLWRGFVRELTALISWAVAVGLILRFSQELGEKIPLPDLMPEIRTCMAAVAILTLTLVVSGIVSALLQKILNIHFEDKLLGSLFGFLRGLLIVCAGVYIFQMTSLIKTEVWRSSILIVPAQQLVELAQIWLPDDLRATYEKFRVR